MDLLLDKADQPYFTTLEKDKFLRIAISDFVNFHYQKMLVDEESRRALAPLIDYNRFNLSPSDIVSGSYIHASSNMPALSEKYTDGGTLDQAGTAFGVHSPGNERDDIGYFLYGTQYVLPKQHLYVITISEKTYNREDIIDPSSGLPYPGITDSDVTISDYKSVKNKSTRDYYEDNNSEDPFNGAQEKENLSWQYIENRITFTSGIDICDIHIETITLPTVERAFGSVGDGLDTYGAISAPKQLVFTDHYQQQIVELAVDKMIKVDVGLMTPPS